MYGMPTPNQYGQYGFAGGYTGFPAATPTSPGGTPAATGVSAAGDVAAGARVSQAAGGGDAQPAQAQWNADPSTFYSQSYWGGMLGITSSISTAN